MTTLIIPIVVAVAISYITAAFVLARQQLIAATRLRAYLRYWQSWVIERELFPLYYEGKQWNDEIKAIIKKGGGGEEFLNLAEEKKKFIAEVKARIEKGEFEYDKEKFLREMQRLPKELTASVAEFFKTSKQNIVEAKTFISDSEATSIGVGFTGKCIELKMEILNFLDGGESLAFVILSSPDDFEIRNYAAEISQLLWRAILIFRDIDYLSDASRNVTSKSLATLTIENMRTGVSPRQVWH